jgi:hypothetical protein
MRNPDQQSWLRTAGERGGDAIDDFAPTPCQFIAYVGALDPAPENQSD